MICIHNFSNAKARWIYIVNSIWRTTSLFPILWYKNMMAAHDANRDLIESHWHFLMQYRILKTAFYICYKKTSHIVLTSPPMQSDRYKTNMYFDNLPYNRPHTNANTSFFQTSCRRTNGDDICDIKTCVWHVEHRVKGCNDNDPTFRTRNWIRPRVGLSLFHHDEINRSYWFLVDNRPS